ncbi:class II glutamine amidotransferase [Escherichia coli]|uniref:class II glutamine amidotransferase n=1 Tax=Escherichia coli TaxID=562 RepID=UPI00063D4870|nr:class II glutamine amidotransferase [Escherichia coli]KLG39010.1 glutamine amidotransferase [Escherichia coli]
MCELLGMSANVPTDICFSFTGLVQRGGGTGPHKDGWGITFYEGKGCRTFKDPQPSFNSPIAKLVQDYPIKSCSVVAHIRQANRGEVALENTHPFTRELWGRNWTYAHNGQLTGYKSLETGNFRPVGETDSEKAFCWLLHKLTQRYPRTPGTGSPAARRFGVATLLDQDVEIDFSSQTTPNDVVTVIATQPLTGNETWQKIMPGEWRLFCLGERVV